MEDVSLVRMDSDKSLELCTFNRCRRNIDQRVEDLLKVVVCGLHDLLVTASVLESLVIVQITWRPSNPIYIILLARSDKLND